MSSIHWIRRPGTLQGRGKRVTLRDAQKTVLADYIFGKPADGKAGWRYVRVPGGKRLSSHASNARRTASGSRAITVKKARAGPLGTRRPCSQCCKVRLLSPNNLANSP